MGKTDNAFNDGFKKEVEPVHPKPVEGLFMVR